MTKTKDELIAEIATGAHLINSNEPCTPSDISRNFWNGLDFGASRMYDHRQKEIDEAYERGKRDFIEATILYEAGKEDADKWWAERWRVFYESGDQPTYNGIIDELNAAAARVMRLDAIKELQEDGQEMEVKG